MQAEGREPSGEGRSVPLTVWYLRRKVLVAKPETGRLAPYRFNARHLWAKLLQDGHGDTVIGQLPHSQQQVGGASVYSPLAYCPFPRKRKKTAPSRQSPAQA